MKYPLPLLLCAVVLGATVFQIRPPTPKPAAVEQPAPKSDPGARYRAAQAAANRSGGGGDTELQRDGSGQFRLTARVNGEDTPFLIDTGADIVALTVSDAQRLGVQVDPGEFQPLMRTASGTGRGAFVQLRSIEVAGHEFANVNAVVMEGLEVNLLGQSVLRRFGSLEMSGDRMIIHAS
ncbi:MAG: TIGR02281 family clan AA aspartic protease [Novosphingobium sp.]